MRLTIVFLGLALASTFAPSRAWTETAPTGAMTGPEFEAYVATSTIVYDYGNGQTGTEQYLTGRRVRWVFDGETCMLGRWYDVEDQICFVYDYDSTPQCWNFYDEAGGLHGHYLGPDEPVDIYEINNSDAPLPCAGPDLGV
jgi:hypothetical protein